MAYAEEDFKNYQSTEVKFLHEIINTIDELSEFKTPQQQKVLQIKYLKLERTSKIQWSNKDYFEKNFKLMSSTEKEYELKIKYNEDLLWLKEKLKNLLKIL